MSDLESVCKRLDQNTDALMDTISQILQAQSELDASMKHGYILMSKARYSLGVNRVSALQYNQDDLVEASAKVNLRELSETDGNHVFSFSLDDCEIDKESDQNTKLRQRKSNVDDLSMGVQDLNMGKTRDKVDRNTDGDSKDTKTRKSNPLNWFGVLVPQSLRQCQASFVRATDQCCVLASLKANMLHLRTIQQDLLKKKKELLPEKDIVESDEDKSTEECSENESL